MTVTEDQAKDSQPEKGKPRHGQTEGAESAETPLGQLHLLPRRDSVLRMSEVRAAELADSEPLEGENSQTMIMNMGPVHPSTHGVLRLMLELDGETILRSKPVIGYLHTGMEKTGEDLTYLQGPTNVTRMDYASPLFSELAFSLAVEKLIGLEVPARATWIRMLMTCLLYTSPSPRDATLSRMPSSA